MRAVLCVLLVVGCSTKEPAAVEKKTPEDKAGEQAAQPPSAPPEAKPPEAKLPEPPAAPAPATNVDCAALLTADDVAKACGGTKVEIAEISSKIRGPHSVCSLKMTEPGKKFPIAHVQLMGFPDVAAAQNWIKLEKIEGSKDVAGIGDMAWTRVKELKGLKSTDYDVGVHKGRFLLKLSMSDGLQKKLPCTIEQLTELAKTVTPRVP